MEINSGDSMALSPWRRRELLPSAPTHIFVINTLLAAVFAALSTVCSVFTMFLLLGIASVFFAVNLLMTRGFVSALALPLSYFFAYLICRSISVAFLSLLFVPLGIMTAAMLYSKATCSTAITAYAALSLGMTAAVWAVVLAVTYGSVPSGIAEISKAFTAAVTEAFKAVTDAAGPSAQELLSEASVALLSRMMISLLPGIYVMLYIIGAAITEKLTWRYLVRLGASSHFRQSGWDISISRAQGIIYIIAYIASFLMSFSESTEFLSYAAINISLIFLPAVFLSGVRSFNKRILSTRGKRIGAVAALVFIALFVPPLLYIVILTVNITGAIAAVKHSEKSPPNDGEL